MTRPKLRRTFRGVCDLCAAARPACADGMLHETIWGEPSMRLVTLCVRCIGQLGTAFEPNPKHREGR